MNNHKNRQNNVSIVQSSSLQQLQIKMSILGGKCWLAEMTMDGSNICKLPTEVAWCFCLGPQASGLMWTLFKKEDTQQ